MSPPTNLEASHLHPLAHLALGPVLQCAEAATLGLPFEVLKTRQGRFRSESVLKSFAAVYEKGVVAGYVLRSARRLRLSACLIHK